MAQKRKRGTKEEYEKLRTIESKLGRTPTDDELSMLMFGSDLTVEAAKKYLKQQGKKKLKGRSD